MPATHFEQVFFAYFEQFKRLLLAQPLLLGGGTGFSGGGGGPPGGFIGVLPQDRVAFDLTEAESLEIPASGESLVNNLNRIRYRLSSVEAATQGLSIYEDGVLIASGITNLDFLTDEVTQTSPGYITISGTGITFLDLLDTPDTYAGEANKYVSVKGNETGLEFITLTPSGGTSRVKVSANDTAEDFLQEKILGGTNVQITVLNEGGYEQLQITSISGVTDHGLLTGLLDDDHPDYLTNSRHDLISRHTLGTVVPYQALSQLTDVSLTSPQAGDALIHNGTSWINSASVSTQKTLTFGQQGSLSVKTLEARLFAPFSGEIMNIVSTVNTPSQGQSIILDILKNGSTIYGTNPSNRPTIAAGANNDMDSTPDTTTFATNDLFTLQIVQVGTTASGMDLVVQIRCST